MRTLLVALTLVLSTLTILPTASASGGDPCDMADVLRTICDKVREEIIPLLDDPDTEWIEDSIEHLCDHWLHACEIGN